jgi:glyoxylase-like metal-dependent hydrolase (beta-lactamase superfamily II)
MNVHKIGPDVSVLADHAEIPGLGFLPVNTFVLHAEQPVVVDTGLSTPDKDFVRDLSAVIDPADVRWIWVTHPDRDHTGGLWQLLDAAPNARIVTTFLGVGIMSCEWPVPLDRVYLLNPGQTLDVGDRTLTAFRPPLFDSPSTTGFVDNRTGAMFTSDCFGAPLPSLELAVAGDLRAAGSVRDAQLLWAAVDSPWVQGVDRAAFQASIDPLRALDPTAVLSTHLPAAVGLNDRLFSVLEEAPSAPAFVGPDQQALEALLASFAPAGEEAVA